MSSPPRPWRDAPSDALRIRRLPERGRYDRETVEAILDEAPICHVGTIDEDGRPIVLPTLHARIGEALYLHGSSGSRNIRRMGAGVDLCVEATILDGLVLARTIFDHSVNYRSVVVRGRAVAVTEREEKLAALRAFSEKLLPGRWDEAIEPSGQELKATAALRLPLGEASAKVRDGWSGHEDDGREPERAVWCGVVPVRLAASAPEVEPGVAADVPLSAAAEAWVDAHR